MTRFVLIELNSGFVWWDGRADTQCDACEQADLEISGELTRYEPISESDVRSGGGGFAVYAVEDDFLEVDDGQSPAETARVERESLQGYCRKISHAASITTEE